jgi:gliding motility-associated-like protein
VTYYWSGPNGFSSTQQNPFVYIPGEYQVIVTGTNGCSDSLTVEVIADDIYPVVATYDDTLNCDITDIELSIDVDLTGVTYNWSGPNSFNSIDPTPTVSIPGIYSITVTSDVGCTTIDSLIVHEDTLTMPLITSFGSLSCNETETDIGVSGLPDDVEIFWTGPGGYTSNDSISTVIEAGNYTLEVVFANGCSRIKTVNVDQNIIPPEFTIGGDTIISCSVGFATLQGTSPVSNASFEWKNELGDIVGTGEMISVSAEGNYTLIVVDPANGCADSASIVVLKDQDTPNLEVRGDTINCIGSTFYISADSDANIFNWEGPNGYSSNMAINQISLPGLYSVTVTADNGCIAVETISVVDDTDEPHINLESEILDCNNTEITISLTSTGLGNIFSWDGPDAYFSNEEDPLVGESGIYIVTVTSSNGCSSIDSILISENIYIPNLNTSISNDINCFLPETTITANSDSIISTYQWTGPEGFAWNQASTQISVPGIYYITAVAENGCENIDSVSVLIDTISPEIQLASGYLDCINLQITIDASISNGQNPEYTWTGPGGFTSSLEDPIVTTGGEYFVTVTNDNGCQSVNHIYVGQDVIVPVSEIEVVEFDCDGSDAQLSATLSESNLSYTWSGPGGAIFDGQTISVAEGGTYSLTVTNESNECSYTLNTQLNELNPVSGFSYETIDPGCLYEFGSIMITDIVGGQGDIMFSIDGGNSYQNSNMFTDLSSGQYEVILLDSNECMTSQEILITELFDFDVTIDPDLIINEGEELNLHLELPFDSSLVETIIWSPGDNLSCTDCLEPLFFGNLSTVISVVVYDINGCSGSAQFKITVKEKSVFAPNVFTPNEDGVNDVFTLFGDETIFMSIKELSIFDRWGNRLYIQKNFPLNTNAGWDGKSKGSYVDDGVYVFYAVVEKADGKLVTLCKDVTVLK